MRYKILTFAGLLIFIALLLFVISGRENDLDVYAVKYGNSFYHSKHIYYNDTLDESLPFAWMFYVAKYKKKIILIDTGFRKKSFIESYSIDYKDPLMLLREINIEPRQVTDVVITHSHFDHIGNVDKFVNAKIYIQKDELEHFIGKSENEEIVNFLKSNKNLIIFEKSYRLYNLFNLEKIGGHTIGSSVVQFSYKDKNYVLSGDECYLLDNCEGKPVGTYYNIEKNKNFIEEISRLENKVILTFHDPLIFDKYLKINNWIAKIIHK